MGRLKSMLGLGIAKALGRFAKATATGDTGTLTQAIMNWLDAGIIPPGIITKTILSQFEATVKKAKKQGQKGGEPVSVSSVMESLDKEPKFMELCEKIGLTREMFEQEAERLLSGGH